MTFKIGRRLKPSVGSMKKKWEIPIAAHLICPIVNSMENVLYQRDAVQMLQNLMIILKDASGIFSLEGAPLTSSQPTNFQKNSLSNATQRKNAVWTTSVRDRLLPTIRSVLQNLNVALIMYLILVLNGTLSTIYVALEMLLIFQKTLMGLIMQQRT